jgi:apolipoprotein N-acyltransferase
MSAATMPPPQPVLAVPRVSRDATPQQIIDAARAAPATAVAAGVVASAGSLLMWAAFTPLEWAPLAWICLVPLACLVRIERPTRAMFRATYIAGLVFWVPALQWMRLGDPTMYGAWLLLSAYLALYFPLFVALGRVAVHRLRVPLFLAVPVVWTCSART